MIRNRLIEVSVVLALLVTLGGCTAGFKMVPVNPLMEGGLRTYSSVVLSVESGVAEDVQKEMNDLQALAIEKIKALGIYQSAQLGEAADAGEGTIIVKATISKIRKVSGFARFMAGAFAGKASMTTDVSFIDAPSKKVIGTYSITGESGGTGYSGGTSDAVKKAAEGIADVLRQYH
jgi:hypothetical protein